MKKGTITAEQLEVNTQNSWYVNVKWLFVSTPRLYHLQI